MNIARPPQGFLVRVNPQVQAFVDQTAADDSYFLWRWNSVIERLKGTAHVAGASVDGEKGHRAGVFIVDEWRIKVVWHVLGSTVTVLLADF